MVRTFREAEHDGWLARAESYDDAFSAITNQANAHILAALGEISGKTMLDICCGPGHLAAAAAARGAKVIGVDFAATMVARAAANHPTIDFREGDAEDLAFEDRSFDRVACSFGIMHVAHPETAFGEARRVLRRGGVYAFTHWALDDELLQIVSAAIAAHGGPPAHLPEAPPLMRFADPHECTRALNEAGFERIEVERIELQWGTREAEAVLALIYSGAVRAAMVIDAQEPSKRTRVGEAIVAAAEKKRASGEILIRRPAVLTTGRRR